MSAVEMTTSRPYCRDDDLPLNPFLALRVSYGMLLGEEDFRDLMGNPRGKQMLHSSWLHGSGVVWGYGVSPDGARCLRVNPGLAIDGLGRELLLDTDRCLDLDKWLHAQQSKGEPVDRAEGAGHAKGAQRPGDCDERVLTTCLVAAFDTCLARPVPALADPCDLSRKHNECSRVVETVRLELRDEDCPGPEPIPGPYHRLRVLLGLDKVDGEEDSAGKLAAERRREIAQEPVDRRVRALLDAFRELAALDVADLQPAAEEGDVCPSLFPATDDDAAVVLAAMKVTVRGDEVVKVEPSPSARRSLIATSTIQELVCGLGPALLGAGSEQDASGPRVVRQSVYWPDDANRLTFKVTSSLLEGSLRDHPVVVTSLSDRGWVREDIERITYDDHTKTVTVVLHDPPAYDHVRVVVRGTGPTPVFGANYVPLAGLEGGPPGTADDGHDAVLNTLIDRRATP